MTTVEMPWVERTRIETIAVLKAAKARLEAKGWGQGYANSGVPVDCKTECAGVAIDRAYHEDRRFIMYSEANDRFRAAIGNRSIIEWNDAPGRTKEEVLAAFDKAILLAESEAAP